MSTARIIEGAWEARDTLNTQTMDAVREAVDEALSDLDAGRARVAEKVSGAWVVHQWLKKAVLLSFRLNDMHLIEGHPGNWWDKVESKFADWNEEQFRAAGFRAVPGSIVRHSAFVAKGAVLMPSFVNVGAYVGENTMVDTWSTVGSCAQIRCELSSFGGVGHRRRAGARASRAHYHRRQLLHRRAQRSGGGRHRRRRLGAFDWCVLTASTKILDRETGEIFQGRVPPYSVVVAGSMPSAPGKPSLSCAVIVKRVGRAHT